MTPVRSTARTLIAMSFLTGGVRAMLHPDASVPDATPVVDRLVPLVKRVAPWAPTDPATLVRVNAGVQVAGGLLLASGRAPRLAAAALAAALVPRTLAEHAFWRAKDPAERREQRSQFVKSLGLLGGLLLAAVDTEGRPGLRWRAGHAADEVARHAGHSVDEARRTARRQAKRVSKKIHR
jgi:putative oxidoreductase